MPKVHTMEVKDQFIELRAKGHTFADIADQLNVSKPTLIEWSKELKTEIENSKALEMESLQEKYFASWKQRLEFTGDQFARLKEELESRDFSDMSTKELLEVSLKFQGQLQTLEKKQKITVESDPIEDMDKMLKTMSTIEI
ncbi:MULTISPECIES: COG3415 family protein [Bacteria]|uniref:hypothetical protein n=1 Tax=Streptomyces huasconensis TaxID=1854574 RepID=UPI003722415D